MPGQNHSIDYSWGYPWDWGPAALYISLQARRGPERRKGVFQNQRTSAELCLIPADPKKVVTTWLWNTLS